jgi:hypothetical protein
MRNTTPDPLDSNREEKPRLRCSEWQDDDADAREALAGQRYCRSSTRRKVQSRNQGAFDLRSHREGHRDDFALDALV